MAKKAVAKVAVVEELTPEQEEEFLERVSKSKKARLEKRAGALLKEVKEFTEHFTTSQKNALGRVLGFIESKPKATAGADAVKASKGPLKYRIPLDAKEHAGKLWSGKTNGRAQEVKAIFDAWLETAQGKSWKKSNSGDNYPLNPAYLEALPPAKISGLL